MGQNYESLLISIMRYIIVNKIQAHLSVGRYGLNRHTMIIVSGNLVPAIMLCNSIKRDPQGSPFYVSFAFEGNPHSNEMATVA